MGLKKKAVEGSVINTVRSILESGAGFVAFLVFARWLAPEHFGQYALASAFVALVKTGLDLGFSRAIIQRETLSESDRDTAFWVMFFMGTLLTAGFWLLANGLVRWFGQPAVAPVLRWLALGLFLHGISDSARALLVRDMAFGYLATVSVVGTLAGAGVGIFMAVNGYGVWSLVFYQLTITTVGVIGFWGGVQWMPGIRISYESFQELWDFGIHVVGKKFLNILGERTDDVLIGFFMGSTLLGYYAVAYRILKLARQLLVQTLINVAIPVFSRLQTETERLRRAFLSAIRVTSFVAFPAFVGLGLLAFVLVPLLFGAKWMPSVPLLQVLVGAGIVDTVLLFHSPVLIAKARTRRDMGLTALHTAILISLFIGAVQINLVAVAGAYVLASALLLPVAYGAVRSLIPISPVDYLRQIFPGVVGGLGAGGTVWIIQNLFGSGLTMVQSLGFSILAGMAGFTVLTSLLVPDQLREMIELVRLLGTSSGSAGQVIIEEEPGE